MLLLEASIDNDRPTAKLPATHGESEAFAQACSSTSLLS
jgi:hypothetical protein